MVVEIVVYLDVEVAEFDVVGESVAYQKRLAAEELLAIGGRRNLVVGDDIYVRLGTQHREPRFLLCAFAL